MRLLQNIMTITLATFSITVVAQKTTDYEKIYYSAPSIIDNETITVEAKNIVSQADHCKMALKVKNNTSDFLFVALQASKFKYVSGEFSPEIKPYFIKPNKSKLKTLLVNGGNEFLTESFNVEIGHIFRVSVNGNQTDAPNFQLPASKNSFTSGNFKIVLKKYDASTKEAKAVFEVTYSGNDMAVVNPSNLSVTSQRRKSDEIVTYANDNKKSEPIILRNGETVKIAAVFHIPGKIVDMQFATMNILWNDTFSETKPEILERTFFKIQMNKKLTEEKK